MNSRWDLAQQNILYTKQKMTKRQMELNYKGTIHVYIWNIIGDDEKSEALCLYLCLSIARNVWKNLLIADQGMKRFSDHIYVSRNNLSAETRIGFIWPTIQSIDGIQWTPQWTFAFQKCGGYSRQADQILASLGGLLPIIFQTCIGDGICSKLGWDIHYLLASRGVSPFSRQIPGH